MHSSRQKKQKNMNDFVNRQLLMQSSDNEVETCLAEILSLESDYSSGGAVDSSDQNEAALEKIAMKKAQISKNRSHGENELKKTNSRKSSSTHEMQYGTPPQTRSIKKDWFQNTGKNDNSGSFNKEHALNPHLNEQPDHAFVPTNSSDKLNFDRNSQSLANSASRFKDKNLNFTEITHKQLKSTLKEIQSLNGDYTSPVSGMHSEPMQKQSYPHNLVISSSYPSFYNYGRSSNQPPVSSASKLDTILHVKDGLLQEKESVINKLQIEIASLRHQLQESEMVLRQIGKSAAVTSHPRIEETSISDSHYGFKEKKLYNLEQLLGKTENKLEELTSQMKHERKQAGNKMKMLEASLKSKGESCSDLKKRLKSSNEKLEKYRHRVESLERYLGDLPTVEESNKLQAEANLLGKERETLVVEIADYKNKLEEKTKVVKIRDDQVKSLTEDVDKKQQEIVDLREKLTESEKSKESLGKNERDDLEDLRLQVSRLQKEKEDATAVASGCEKRIKLLQEKHNSEVENLRSMVKDSEELAETARREVFMKQQTSKKVSSTVKSISSQNQQLLDENLNLQENVKNFEKLNSNLIEVSRTCSKLLKETSGAIRDLKGVTQVLIETADGSDPNISVLLGVRSDTSGWSEDDDSEVAGSNPGFSIEDGNKRLFEVRQLRRDIENLRTTLSNRYADAIGDNCVTQ